MKLGPIDSGRIEAMAARLQAAAAKATPAPTSFPAMATMATTARVGQTADVSALSGTVAAGRTGSTNESTQVSFSDSLKKMLDSVNEQQTKADAFSKRFALGDDSVNLSDVMIERQKASLSLQATVQVRNKLVSAYHEIMNMQV